LNSADRVIEELEIELLKVHQQMLDHLSDSQVKTSEIRGEVDQTRWQLLQESGVQRTELLGTSQDIVNRIIQIGENNKKKIIAKLRQYINIMVTPKNNNIYIVLVVHIM
jgi:hypothetical protein